MKLSDLITQYISHKRALGMRFDSSAATLAAFHRRLESNIDIKSVTVEQVHDFLTGNRPLTNHWGKRKSVLVCFFRFALTHGHITVAPLPTYSPKLPPPLAPHIYSKEELKRLLDAVPVVCKSSKTLQPYLLHALILILYGACLRRGEALRLTMRDVDLKDATLHIRESKFYKTRLIPMGADLNAAMQRYARQRKEAFSPEPDAPFFCARNGHSLAQSTVSHTFQQLRVLANVTRDGGPTCQPRLHDLRHTGAVHRLIEWYRSGIDLQMLLPQLSTYLGHVNLAATQRYLTLTPELLSEASKRFEAYALENNHG